MGFGDVLRPWLLPLTFVALLVFAPAAESRVPHRGAVREALAEDPGPCSHHFVSEAQAQPAWEPQTSPCPVTCSTILIL